MTCNRLSCTNHPFSEYELVANKKRCKGRNTQAGNFPKVSECAAKCRGISKSMFTYDRKGTCWCQTDSKNGKCFLGQKDNWYVDLYRIR